MCSGGGWLVRRLVDDAVHAGIATAGTGAGAAPRGTTYANGRPLASGGCSRQN
jgi:hypothetical protein